MPLFTDMSVIDHYFINQSIELANNMTYMREAKPLGAKFLSISQYLLSFLPSADLGYRLYLQYKLVFSLIRTSFKHKTGMLISRKAWFRLAGSQM